MTDTANAASTTASQTRLETQLAELEARFSHLERDLDEPLNADSSEQAIEMEDDQSLEAQALLVTRDDRLGKARARPDRGWRIWRVRTLRRGYQSQAARCPARKRRCASIAPRKRASQPER